MTDSSASITELKAAISQFMTARGWEPESKNLATSVSIEAGELLELFQWSDWRTNFTNDKLAGELADVIIYALRLADAHNIDVSAAVEAKLRHASQKYPVQDYAQDPQNSNYYRAKAKAREGRS
jgi:NTP pyrophosphatase (non-canonical NTP hydrolase)